ncbi:MAG: glycosyltransferase family 4 protein [Saprospiraceae bacterium]|nr:glycosyltransferase family 4 protein [Saprospiraceae bacterium]
MKLLIFIDWYFPAYRGGGPIVSVRNLAELLKDDVEIFVVTSDKDLEELLPIIDTNVWILVDKVKVNYLSSNKRNVREIYRLIKSVEPDAIYLNSMYSKIYTIIPLLCLLLIDFKPKIILAPRGMLHQGAVKYRQFKKKLFLLLFRAIGFNNRVFFHATDKQESDDIVRLIKASSIQVQVVPNVVGLNGLDLGKVDKNKNRLKIAYISRITPKKNLLYFLKILERCDNAINIDLSIYGHKEMEYWKKCNDVIQLLPFNIKVSYLGTLPHNSVAEKIMENHFTVLPTLGENFGHSIFESFAAGRPVLISDQTPWRNLEKKNIGWDIPLKEKDLWLSVIERMAEMSQDEYDSMSQASWDFAKEYSRNMDLKDKYIEMFS